ncbi:isochorismatase family protein [Candidatus Rhodobacter oscarellae]|uniref:isochorismatase family protein n=1 Tax=Candidatus Rhodobacter oscarellae TaxID=1675527 RepID=UPI0009E50D18|nr:isochorismatase family protein [Candidatus Rhodobacter lobularis]
MRSRAEDVWVRLLRVVGTLPTLRLLVQNDGPTGHRLEVGSEGWEIVPALGPDTGEIVVNKKSCGSFHDTDLLQHLTQMGASRLIIGGCMTQYCVDTTVRRAVSQGFDVVLVSDGPCTGDAGALRQGQIIAHHNQTLDGFDAGQYSVQIQSARDIVFMPA